MSNDARNYAGVGPQVTQQDHQPNQRNTISDAWVRVRLLA